MNKYNASQFKITINNLVELFFNKLITHTILVNTNYSCVSKLYHIIIIKTTNKLLMINKYKYTIEECK